MLILLIKDLSPTGEMIVIVGSVIIVMFLTRNLDKKRK